MPRVSIITPTDLTTNRQYMHQNEFIHRDLKPEVHTPALSRPSIPDTNTYQNLLVQDSTYWKIKIGDFGISKSTVGTTARTQTGTRHFMAPEIIWQSRANYTKAVDIWSLGAVLFLMLTGQMLFSSSEKLLAYYSAKDGAERLFPVYPLEERSVSDDAVMFLRGVLAPLPWDRPGARECLLSPWLRGVVEPV